jgi:hypothetical protein
MDFAQQQFGDEARKRFAEDVVELLSNIGREPRWEETLGLETKMVRSAAINCVHASELSGTAEHSLQRSQCRVLLPQPPAILARRGRNAMNHIWNDMKSMNRFWMPLRRRATHNRLFDRLADLRWSLRSSLSYFQTVKGRVRRLIAGCYAAPEDWTLSALR